MPARPGKGQRLGFATSDYRIYIRVQRDWRQFRTLNSKELMLAYMLLLPVLMGISVVHALISLLSANHHNPAQKTKQFFKQAHKLSLASFILPLVQDRAPRRSILIFVLKVQSPYCIK